MTRELSRLIIGVSDFDPGNPALGVTIHRDRVADDQLHQLILGSADGGLGELAEGGIALPSGSSR